MIIERMRGTLVGIRRIPVPVWLSMCVLVALLLRLAFLFLVWGPERPVVDDGIDYDRIAVNLIENGYFAGKTDITARRPPLYPFFLSWIYRTVGHLLLAVRLVQCLLAALLPLLVYSIAAHLYSRDVARLSALITAVYPVFIYLPSRFLTENLFLFILTAAVCYTVWARHSIPAMVISGMLFGLAILTRPAIMLLPPFFAVWLWWNEERLSRVISLFLAFVLGIMFVVSPWTVRNYLVFDRFIPVTTNSGITFMHDNNPYVATLGWAGPQNRIFRPSDVFPDIDETSARWVGLGEADQDKILMARTWDWIFENPLEFAKLIPRKYISFFNYRQAPNTVELRELLMDVVSLLSYGLLLPFMFIGFGWSLKCEPPKQRILHMFVLTFLAGVFLYAGSVRLRIPLEPCLIIFASYALHRLLDNTSGVTEQADRVTMDHEIRT